jgi:prolipoprotein diacylglyceryltransferase
MFLTPNLQVKLFNRSVYAFHFFGVLGFIFGLLLGIFLCYATGLQVIVILYMSLTGAATFFLLAFGAKIITGKEVIVYYHHEIAILIMCSLALWILRFPVLPYLDITLMGIATFLAFGRIGCFSVGCCHGKPFKGGVMYGREHAKKGFTSYYIDVPLLPVQLMESAFVFLVVISGVVLIILRFPPGTFLTVYTVIYGSFRFVIEFFRGDAERPYFKGLSEAQWTTILLIGISVIFAILGFMTFYWWHIVLSALIFCAGLYMVLKGDKLTKWTNPRQLLRIENALDLIRLGEGRRLNTSFPATNIKIGQIENGINLSGGEIIYDGKLINHFTVSSNERNSLNALKVEKIAKMIQQIRRLDKKIEITEKQNQVFHILFI